MRLTEIFWRQMWFYIGTLKVVTSEMQSVLSEKGLEKITATNFFYIKLQFTYHPQCTLPVNLCRREHHPGKEKSASVVDFYVPNLYVSELLSFPFCFLS